MSRRSKANTVPEATSWLSKLPWAESLASLSTSNIESIIDATAQHCRRSPLPAEFFTGRVTPYSCSSFDKLDGVKERISCKEATSGIRDNQTTSNFKLRLWLSPNDELRWGALIEESLLGAHHRPHIHSKLQLVPSPRSSIVLTEWRLLSYIRAPSFFSLPS